jgi:hypothetical protein
MTTKTSANNESAIKVGDLPCRAPPSDPEGPCSSDIPNPSALIALFSRMNGSFGILEQSMSELTKYLVLAVAFVAFILAGYIQGGGEWRGPHSLRKSIHPKGGTIGLQDAHPPSEVAYKLSRTHWRAS